MWIHESIKRSKRMKDHFNLNGISVIIKDKLPEDVDPEFIHCWEEYKTQREEFGLGIGQPHTSLAAKGFVVGFECDQDNPRST